MSDDTRDDRTVEERLSEDLGFDVSAVEAVARFRVDHERMKRGEHGELGYVFLDRQDHPDAVVVFATPKEAEEALDEHPLIDELTAEDCTDAFVLHIVDLYDVAGREVIIA